MKRRERKSKRGHDPQVYAEFAAAFPFCFACGATRRKLDIAHIVGGSGRVCDRRDIIRLCFFPCHRLAHGDTIRERGLVLPHLTLSHMVELKREYDMAFLDIPYLMTLRIKRCEPIVPERLPAWFYEQRHASNPAMPERFW